MVPNRQAFYNDSMCYDCGGAVYQASRASRHAEAVPDLQHRGPVFFPSPVFIQIRCKNQTYSCEDILVGRRVALALNGQIFFSVAFFTLSP